MSEKRILIKLVGVRMDEEEYYGLSILADKRKMSMAGICRHLIFRKRSPESWLPTPPTKIIIGNAEHLRKLHAELNKQGKNINDLARAANTDATVPELNELRKIKIELSKMTLAIVKVLGV